MAGQKLVSGADRPCQSQWRWRSISDESLSTVHLHLARSLIDSAADQADGAANRDGGGFRECQSFLRADQAWLRRDAACLPVARLRARLRGGMGGGSRAKIARGDA
jgi:hypothetical protein